MSKNVNKMKLDFVKRSIKSARKVLNNPASGPAARSTAHKYLRELTEERAKLERDIALSKEKD